MTSFLGTTRALQTSRLRSLFNRDHEIAETLKAVALRVRDEWPEARAAVLWDGDVVLAAPASMRGNIVRGGLVLTDVRNGTESATGRVTFVSVKDIRRVELTEQVDHSRNALTIDPARQARQAGYVAGFVSSFGGTSPMALAWVLNRMMSMENQPMTWQTIDVETTLPMIGTLRLQFCCERAAACAVAEAIRP